MRLRMLSLLAAASLVAACSTAKEEMADASSTAADASDTATTAVELPGPTPGTQEDLVVQVGDRVFFDFDSSTLKPEGQATVEGLAAWMRTYPEVSLTVEGHADERGTREYNLALGERRANAVRDYLAALGVSGGRLTTISYGKERPAVLGSYEEAWAQNRRGVFVVN